MPQIDIITLARFWSKTNKTATCWVWTGAKTSTGYGRFRYKNGYFLAHRFSVFMNEKLIPGLEVDHLCRNRACVNPDHLEQVTHIENLRRSPIHFMMNPDIRAAYYASKTHCKHGHEYTPDNTRLKKGRRSCKACSRDYANKWRQKQAK